MFSARVATRALRTPIARSFSRLAVSTPQRPLLTSLCKSAIARQPRFAAPFSTTTRQLSENAVDEELAMKLEAELKLESEIKEFDEAPEVVRGFLETSPFTLNDKPGQNEVELVRKFGDETIRVTFTISDINHPVEDEADPLYDEVAEDGEGNRVQAESSPTSSGRNKSDLPEDEEFDEEEDTPGESFPARVDVTIEKPNHGALLIEAIAQDGMMVIENVLFHKNTALLGGGSYTAEADWQRRGTYGGPPFGNLDEDLQVLFERYLDERGINTSLALFIPEYIDFKEQREYLKWLENVRGFVSA